MKRNRQNEGKSLEKSDTVSEMDRRGIKVEEQDQVKD